MLSEPWSGASEIPKLVIGSPPDAQASRRVVGVVWVASLRGTLWDRFAHTGGVPAPIRRFTVRSGPTSSLPPDPLPGETPRYMNESAPDAPGLGV